MSALTKNDGQFYEGFSFKHAPEFPGVVWSVGATPAEAIAAFVDARIGEKFDPSTMQELPDGDPAYHWGYRFVADGTSFKAAGQFIPGGAVLTWWK